MKKKLPICQWLGLGCVSRWQEAIVLKPMFVLLVLISAGRMQQQAAPTGPADASADAKAMVNPVKASPASQLQAKKMYGYDCSICHGDKGDGKGEIAAEQKPALKDWTDRSALQDMTDGEIFYVIKNGKGTMSGEGTRLKDDDLWNMVIYVRTFAKKS
jgi:mono/diheme cytochrome c family protein